MLLALVNISKDLMRTVFDDEILSDSIFLMFIYFDNASAEDNLAIDASVAALYSVDNFARWVKGLDSNGPGLHAEDNLATNDESNPFWRLVESINTPLQERTIN